MPPEAVSNAQLVAYLDSWLALTLSATTIALAILGVSVGFLALWGYHSLKSEALIRSENAAKEKLDEYLQSQEIRDKLERVIEDRVGRESDQLFQDLKLAWQWPLRESDGSKPIGREYTDQGEP